MKRKIFLALTFFVTLYTQSQTKHEININLGTGYSSLGTNLNHSTETSSKLNPVFGIAYSYKINLNLGLISGIELAKYYSKISSDEVNDQYMTSDNYNNPFEWRLSINHLQEELSIVYLNIPLLLQFTPARMNKFYTNFGLKIGLPLEGKYESNYESLVSSGYYPETDAEYTDINFRGFGEFEGSTDNGNTSFNLAVQLHLECGMKWSLSNSLKLYLGGYVDYGLNDILKRNNYNRIITYDYDNPTNFVYNSLSNSEYTLDGTTYPYINKMTPYSIGLRVNLGFSL